MQGDPWLAMKTRARLQVVSGALAEVRKAFQGEERVLDEVLGAIEKMTVEMVENVLHKKKEVKVISKE